jgi:hypothetical protein
MNNESSKRIVIAVVILVVGMGAVALIGNRMFLQPYTKARAQLDLLETEVEKKEREQHQFRLDQANAAKWKKKSLRKDADLAITNYGNMLQTKLVEFGLTLDTFDNPNSVQANAAFANAKKARHIILPFKIKAKATVSQVAKALEALQRMPVMHRVSLLDLERADDKDLSGKMNVQMTIEAMIVHNANNEIDFDKLTFQEPLNDRPYAEIEMRDPFVGLQFPPKVKEPRPTYEPVDTGPPLPEILEYVVLDTTSVTNQEAFIRNKILPVKPIRVKPQGGFDTFYIYSNEQRSKPILRGKVLRIDDRAIHFQVGEDVHTLKFYETMAQAVGRRLKAEEVQELGLTDKIDPTFTKVEAPENKKGNNMGFNLKTVKTPKKDRGSK